MAGVLAETYGGTGQSAVALGDILFGYDTGTWSRLAIGSTGKVLTVSGAGDPEWADAAGGGTVTSVQVSGGSTGLEFDDGPITTSGTITVSDASVLLADYGGTGLNAASYQKGDIIWCSDVYDDIPTLDVLGIGDSDYKPVLTSIEDAGGADVPNWTSISELAVTEILFKDGDEGSNPIMPGENDFTFVNGVSIECAIGTGNVTISYVEGPSDEAFKENVKNLSGSLEKVEALRPVEFDWNELAKSERKMEGHDIGLIAQDVETVVPEVVGIHKEFKTLNYEKLTPLLIAAVQELSAEVKDLKKRLGEVEQG